jgi:hypothetical protein
MNDHGGHEKRSVGPSVSDTPATLAAAAEADRLADLVRELTGRVSELSATAAMWQARAGMLEERMLALQAPQEPATVERPRRRVTRPQALTVAVFAALLVASTLAPAWVR